MDFTDQASPNQAPPSVDPIDAQPITLRELADEAHQFGLDYDHAKELILAAYYIGVEAGSAESKANG